MSEEKKKILQMVADGKLTPDEADRLLNAVKDARGKNRFFKVRVYGKTDRDKPTVNVNIPIAVLKLASKLGRAFKGMMPEGMKVNMHGKEIALDEFTPEMIDEVLDGLAEGEKFLLAEVTDETKGEYVEVYIE